MIDDGTILRSQANLVAARAAAWGDGERELARRMLDRIAAQARARAYREVRTRFPGCNDALLARGQGAFRRGRAVRRADLVGHADAALPARRRSTSLRASCANAAPQSIVVAEIEYVFAPDNPLYAKLADGLVG